MIRYPGGQGHTSAKDVLVVEQKGRGIHMTSNRITVVARITARAGVEETVRRELLALVAPTTRESGCISYDLHQSADDRALFMFYENWRSREDLDDHLNTPHFLAFQETTAGLLAEPVEISFWELID